MYIISTVLSYCNGVGNTAAQCDGKSDGYLSRARLDARTKPVTDWERRETESGELLVQ